ncbi:hypothetical protein BSLA_02r3781 [Burkholderia stabilis]|nr:hypothetical protein BSLA_02r3781 [Burkholderia stabilis]
MGRRRHRGGKGRAGSNHCSRLMSRSKSAASWKPSLAEIR